MVWSIEDALFYKLSNAVAISGIVSNRIYPLRLPDNSAIPAVSYQRINSTRQQTLGGRVTYCEAIFQFDSWSTTYTQTKTLAAALFALLEGFRGVVTDGISSVDIQSVLSENEIDLYEDEVRWFRRSQVFRITFIEQ